VTGGDVGDLVRHHSRQLSLAFRPEHQPRVHEEEPPRQRKRVDIPAVDHLDRERHLGVGVADQVLANTVDVLGDDRVVDDLGVAFDVLSDGLAQSDFLL